MRRCVDFTVATVGLVLLLPVWVVVGLLVAWQSGRPVMFIQSRVGRHGRLFRLWKFRTMIDAPGTMITAGEDPRITRLGRWLRRYKVDELPQLWNVWRGEMSLIGARPEVPAYVDQEDRLWRRVLAERPGITGLASLVYREEAKLLAAAEDPERLYRQQILPDKLKLNIEYLEKRSWRTDCLLLWWTARSSWLAAEAKPEVLRRLMLGESSL